MPFLESGIIFCCTFFFFVSSSLSCLWRGWAENQYWHVSWAKWKYMLSWSLGPVSKWRAERGSWRTGSPQRILRLERKMFSALVCRQQTLPCIHPKAAFSQQELWGFFFHLPLPDFVLKGGVLFRSYSTRSQTTWEKPGVCDRRVEGGGWRISVIFLRLGRNSPRESEYSCFPHVCRCYSSFTCSFHAEPKTIGERAHGPSGMLAVSNSYN